DDLNTPQALAVLWEMLKSNIPSGDKYDLALSFDEVLGLELNKGPKEVVIPDEINKLIEKRNTLRKEGKFEEADRIRRGIEEKGFSIGDEKIS
ncbi:MAG: DALR domain-containing protein, partial [Patescibacteria group bacterium]